MRLKSRMLLLLLPAIIAALAVLTVLSYRDSLRNAEESARRLAEAVAQENARVMLEQFEHAQAAALSLARTGERLRAKGDVPRDMMRETVAGTALSSKDFVGAWLLWAENAYDGKDAAFAGNEELGNATGRANAFWLYENGELVYDVSEDYDKEKYYYQPRDSRRMMIMQPYRDMDTTAKIFMTSVVVPMFDGNSFLGVAGVDIGLDYLNALIAKVKPYGNGYAVLLNDTGMVIASPKADLAGKALEQAFPSDHAALLRSIKEGKAFSRQSVSAFTKEPVLEMFLPVKLRAFSAPWYFAVALPLDQVMAGAKRELTMSLTVSVMTLLALVVLVFFTAGSIARPIAVIGAYAKKVAGGEHAAVLDQKGFSAELKELGVSLAAMLEALLASMRAADEKQAQAAEEAAKAHEATKEAEQSRQVSEQGRREAIQAGEGIQAVARRLQETSASLISAIHSVESRVRSQEDLMHETVDAVSRMAETTNRVASSASDAAGFAERTRERAETGSTVVHDAIKGFDGVHSETEAIGEQMQDLRQRTEGIGSILEIINDIADQTNLLALNAAIEAARAGDAGRGFAVVADEVRKLAEKTMQATTQVDQAVRGIQDSMREGSERVTRASAAAAETMRLGNDARASLDDIVGLVHSVTKQIHGIAGLCQEQSADTGRISGTVDSLSSLSSQVRSDVDQSEDAARLLEPEADELARLVDELTRRKA